jgi:hypothetical protein
MLFSIGVHILRFEEALGYTKVFQKDPRETDFNVLFLGHY